MHYKDSSTSLIPTKFHKPILSVDLVPRPRLTRWLDQNIDKPLILVSAPAGYGKSTLISHWSKTVEYPVVWLSLDERDNDLSTFLRYFITAVQAIFPGKFVEMQSLLLSLPLPPPQVLSNVLLNDFNQIEESYILVLDDYHFIESTIIHDLMNNLLNHPPPSLHLVLATRMDPPLSLVTLRAKSQLTEIRTQDLRFTREESDELLSKMFGSPIQQETTFEMDVKAEGWVTGLRLAALAMRHRIGQDAVPRELSAQNRYVTEYLISEILSRQAANLSDCMLKTSILERFCAGLCQAVCNSGQQVMDASFLIMDITGRDFMTWLEKSNLFVVPLDDKSEWYRYHHLFQDFLKNELAERYSPEEVRKLHFTAGQWFASHGWIDEALNHYLLANDLSEAILLVAQHRHSLMNDTQWSRLDGWLKRFQEDVVEASPELWMLKTWLEYHQGQFSELPSLLNTLSKIINHNSDQDLFDYLAGEIHALRSLVSYHQGDYESTIENAQKALELIPSEAWIVRIFARMCLGGGLLIKGDENGGYHAFYGAFKEEKVQNRRFKATLLVTACYYHWITADLQSMVQASTQAIALCKEVSYNQILGLSSYHMGCVRYQQNELSQAEELFTFVVNRPYQNYGTCYATSACGLAFTYQAQGKEEEATNVSEAAISFFLETGNTTQLSMLLALQAELALMQGRLSNASQWADKFESLPPLRPIPWFISPYLTLVKILLAQKTPSSLKKAGEFLNQMRSYLESIHDTRFLIEAMALQAIFLHMNGDSSAAVKTLFESISLAEPGGFIRLFVDLGEQIYYLLGLLKVEIGSTAYIDEILTTFPVPQTITSAKKGVRVVENLTNRELEIIELLERRLSNKEIAGLLFITAGTVKGHTIRIYQKLDVKNRRQAVKKAITLGILSPQ